MFPIKQTIKRKGTGYTAREWNKILKRAWFHAGSVWHRFILPKHFTRVGKLEYRYKERRSFFRLGNRGLRYNARKIAEKGHRRPEVWDGVSERMARRIRDVRSTSQGARVIVRVPAHFNAHIYNPNQPDKAAELRAVSERDAAFLARAMDGFISREANKPGGKTVDITKGHRR